MSAGFTLVEVIIALCIFSAVILSLAGLAFQIAKRSTRATDNALSMAAQKAGVDKASTTPFDSLSAILTADTTFSSTMTAVNTYVIDSVSATRKNVRVITTTIVAGSKPDTILIARGRIRYLIPLR